MSKTRIVATFLATRWRQFKSREALERHQRRELRRQLAFLRLHSPMFADAPDLAGLPLLDKATMMARFDELNTLGLSRSDVERAALNAGADGTGWIGTTAIGLSSGTSGHRGVFLTSPAERDRWAGTILAWTLPRRRRWWGHRIALFLRANNDLYQTVRSRAIDFRFYDTHGDLAEHAKDLASYDPTILVAAPSVLDEIAAAGISIHPERVYSVAEVLTDADADRLAQAFGQPFLHQLYQCTEGLLARTCELGTLHLNEELVIFEKEQIAERRFIPIVTDLHRRSQPIIRYRLNDILVERDQACPCGSALTALERIEGREDDTLVIAGRPVFADALARAMVTADGFTQFQIRQVATDQLEVALDELSAAPAVSAALDKLWQRLQVAAPQLTFLPYQHQPTQKRRRIQRAQKGDLL